MEYREIIIVLTIGISLILFIPLSLSLDIQYGPKFSFILKIWGFRLNLHKLKISKSNLSKKKDKVSPEKKSPKSKNDWVQFMILNLKDKAFRRWVLHCRKLFNIVRFKLAALDVSYGSYDPIGVYKFNSLNLMFDNKNIAFRPIFGESKFELYSRMSLSTSIFRVIYHTLVVSSRFPFRRVFQNYKKSKKVE